MQRTKKRTEIRIETETLIRVRRTAGEQPATCPVCLAGRMVTPAGAAELASVSTREIYRFLEAGRLHFRETPPRQLLICSDSLLKQMTDKEPLR